MEQFRSILHVLLAAQVIFSGAAASSEAAERASEGSASLIASIFGAGGHQVPVKHTVLPFEPAECFVEPTYSAESIEVIRDVEYGTAWNWLKLRTVSLHLDAYFPPHSDSRKERPLVVLMHGGSFTGGDRTSDSVPDWATKLAQRGYVAVSIDYRLLPPVLAILDYTRIGPLMAASDARQAVRYVRSRASEWRIDANRVAVGGDSAGAIGTLGYAYLKAEEPASGYPSGINGIISISGAAKADAYCSYIDPDTFKPYGCVISSPPAPDDTDKLVAGDIPAVLLHGTADKVIPYYNGRKVSERATQVGVRNLFITIPGAAHIPMQQILDPKEPYLAPMMTFVSGMLNLAKAECPTPSLTAANVSNIQETLARHPPPAPVLV